MTIQPAPPDCRAWADVDLAALRHNAAVVRELIGPQCGIMAVIKANGYGHGLVPVAEALREMVQMFGVANLAEALALPRDTPVFILGPALPGERLAILSHGFIPSISSLAEAEAFQREARTAGIAQAPVHLVIDTGMGRIGVWQDEAIDTLHGILKLPNLTVAGVASHLPSADEDESYTADQIAHYARLVAGLRRIAPGIGVTHVLNSAGTIRFPSQAGDMVRTGLMLYGSSPVPAFQPRLKPVLSLKTRVALVRDVGPGRSISYGRTFITDRPMTLATLAIGYGDGYPRALSGRGTQVLIRGTRCDLVGRVTMDQIVVDVSEIPDVAPGEEAVLIGSQAGECILAAELAAKAGTIPWEIMTGIKQRVTRIYLGGIGCLGGGCGRTP